MLPDQFILKWKGLNMPSKVISCAIFALMIATIIMIEVPKDANAQPSIQWERIFGGESEDYIYSMEQTSDGGYILIGTTSSYATGGFDAWLIKIDSLGNEQWMKTYNIDFLDEGFGVKQTSDGGFILIGLTGMYTSITHDYWLIKTDAFGNKQWDRTFDNGGDCDRAGSIQITPDGGYIIIGHTYTYGAWNFDIWLIKTDPAGNLQWDKTFGKGGYNDDRGYSLLVTSDGGYALLGYTESYGVGRVLSSLEAHALMVPVPKIYG
jgi:hypothetical protein